jgi:uncharacterized membrane protein YgcG
MKFSRRVTGLVLALAAVITVLLPAQVFAVDLSNFSVRSFEADYYLTRDEHKRSKLVVTENIVVEFPPYAQNHGIKRAIPNNYDGHSVGLKISSVKNDDGKALTYSTDGSNGNTVVRIGDPEAFVTGVKTYVISYELKDVIKQYDGHDEIYWDVNGTDWGQTFGSIKANLHVSGDIAKAFSGKYTCFEGVSRSSNKCNMTSHKKGNETILTFQSTRMMYAGENVSFVAGFKQNTFAPYQKTTWQRVMPVILAIWFGLGAVVFILVAIRMYRVWQQSGKSPAGKGTIVPEYISPKDMSVLMSSSILKHKGSDITAQIMDLAVRHYIKIYETEAKGNWFRSKKSYELEIVRKLTGLRKEEKRLLEIIFGEKPQIGARVTLDKLKSKLYKETTKLEKEVESQAKLSGYIADMDAVRKKHYIFGAALLGGGALVLNPGIVLAGLMVIIVAANLHPLTDKGVASRDYLRGLEMYMKLAEAERIRVLQSPEGAVKTAINPNNTKRMITLYERLLPYAIIFGIEKDWAKQFAPLYQQPPDWYAGDWSTFNAAVFASSLNNFAATSNTTFSPPESSSSSGFSSGGFSGGGGGGGGGGGW